jgi:hypothetical protein
MSEKEPVLHPELEAALKAHELAVLDGTDPEIKAAYQNLRRVQQQIGRLAHIEAGRKAKQDKEPPEAAAS